MVQQINLETDAQSYFLGFVHSRIVHRKSCDEHGPRNAKHNVFDLLDSCRDAARPALLLSSYVYAVFQFNQLRGALV